MKSACTSKKDYVLKIGISLLVFVMTLLCFFPCVEFHSTGWSSEAMDYIPTITVQDGNPLLVVILGCAILIGVWARRLIFSWLGLVASVVTVGNSFRLYGTVLINEILGQIQYFIMPEDGAYWGKGEPSFTENGCAVLFISIVVLVLYIIFLIREILMRKRCKQVEEQT